MHGVIGWSTFRSFSEECSCTGKTLFAQLPATRTTFGGSSTVWRRSPGPAAFLRRAIPVHGLRPATCRESLRDIETCLRSTHETLSHGLPPAGPALDAGRCQRKARLAYPSALAQRLITQARTLYIDEELGKTDQTAAPWTRRHRCLSVFPWAHFRTTKAAVKMHTLLDLRGNFRGSRMASCTTFMPWFLPEAGAKSWLRDSPSRGLLRHACQVAWRYSARRIVDRHHCDQTISLGFYTRQDYPELLRRIRFKDRAESGKTLVFITNNLLASGRQAGGTLLQIQEHLRSSRRHVGERGRRRRSGLPSSVYVLVAIVTTWTPRSTHPLGDPLRENAHTSSS